MNVILVNGSPHAKGCTNTALEEVAKTLRAEGIETHIFQIGTKPLAGCIACKTCARTGRCTFSDCVNEFLDLAKVFQRPFDKGDGYDHQQYTLKHETDALEVYAAIDRSKVCTLVEEARPARYECVPILSLEEEAALGKF